jgi:anti-sigma B factor antagonist
MGDVSNAYGCRTSRAWLGPTAVISVAGTVDMLSSPSLAAALTACLDDNPVAMIVDLSETEFLASAGLSVLTSAAESAAESGIGFGIVADSPATSRPIKLIGLDKVLNLHPRLDTALAALPN